MRALVRRHPTATDVGLAIVLAVAALISVNATVNLLAANIPGYDRPSTVTATLCMLAITVPVVARRWLPLTTLAAITVAFVVGRYFYDMPETSVTLIALDVGLFSAALHGKPPRRAWVLGAAYAAICLEVFRELFFTDVTEYPGRLWAQWFLLVYNAMILALPWALGAVIRSLQARGIELARRADELQREREERAAHAVFDERVRIARELHDVVAHHVSVMGVQAGAARHVMARDPSGAQAALASVEAASREAVAELHNMLGFLRQGNTPDDPEDLAPQPGLREIEPLVAKLRSAALHVDLDVTGTKRELPRTLELSAYRVVQEALTNTLKHGNARHTSVTLAYEPTTLTITIVDDGSGAPSHPDRASGGVGLIGMRERVHLHGGQLRARPRPEGGFAVHATFPIPEASQ